MTVPVSKLRWLCRRGMRELDLILGGFLENEYADLPPALQLDFEELLKHIDQDILEWLMCRSSPPPSLKVLVESVIAHLSRRQQ
jgi:antitoxin CptB